MNRVDASNYKNGGPQMLKMDTDFRRISGAIWNLDDDVFWILNST